MNKTLNNTLPGMARAEYLEVESNVRLHLTDAGEGKPIVLIHGWPLSAFGKPLLITLISLKDLLTIGCYQKNSI